MTSSSPRMALGLHTPTRTTAVSIVCT
jgi:hypothetical protein